MLVGSVKLYTTVWPTISVRNNLQESDSWTVLTGLKMKDIESDQLRMGVVQSVTKDMGKVTILQKASSKKNHKKQHIIILLKRFQ